MAGDPFSNNVSLLLHCDGENGSTTFTDVIGHAVTAHGNASITTAQKKFGTGSAAFDGTADWLSVPTAAEFEFGSGDFTLECWCRITSFAAYNEILAKRAASSAYGPFLLATNVTDGKLIFQASVGGAAWDVNITASAGPALNTWAFIAVTRLGNVYTVSLNSTAVGTATVSGSLMTNAADVVIGAAASDGAYSVNGQLDEIRITKGVARAITTPTEAFPDTNAPPTTGPSAFIFGQLAAQQAGIIHASSL
jgi:hypothetical protein